MISETGNDDHESPISCISMEELAFHYKTCWAQTKLKIQSLDLYLLNDCCNTNSLNWRFQILEEEATLAKKAIGTSSSAEA